MDEQSGERRRVTPFHLVSLNTYWFGLSYMWNSLHLLILPALMLNFVADQQKNTALGLLTFGGLIMAMVVQPISGAISDRWVSRLGRRRPLILVGTALDLAFLATMALAGGIPALAIGYIGLQLTSNVAHGPAQGLMHDLVPSRKMGVASAVKNLFDMGGMVVSSLMIGRIFNPASPVTAFAIVAAILLAGAAVTMLGVRENAPRHPALPASLSSQIGGAFKLDLRKHGTYLRLILFRLLFLSGVNAIQAFAQYYIRDTLRSEDPIRLTGDLLATIVIALVGFSLLAGYLCDRLGRKPMHVVAAVLVGGGSLLMTTARTAGTMLGFGSIVGAGIGFFISANWALVNDLAPVGEAGKFLGLTNLATGGAQALSRLAGPAVDALNNAWPGLNRGYTALFIAACLLSFASLLLLRRVPDPLRKRTSDWLPSA